MFCPKCKSLLFPKEGKLYCRRCDTIIEPNDVEKVDMVTKEGTEKEMVVVEDTIRVHKVTQGNRTRLRKKIEQAGKQVKRNFSYTKIGDYIRDDFRSEDYGSE